MLTNKIYSVVRIVQLGELVILGSTTGNAQMAGCLPIL